MANSQDEPILLSAPQLERWSLHQPMMMRLAAAWARWVPRARGVVPRWIGRACGTDWRTTIRTQSGAQLAVDPSNLDIYTTILRQGSWEGHVAEACVTAVRDGDLFMDVGANAGYMSLEVASNRPNSTVVAFEPQARLAELVAIGAALSKLENISVFKLAIGDQDGSIDLFVPSHSVHASVVESAGADRVSCRLRRIDTLVAEAVCACPSIIKIDVEGAEFAVLRGAESTIRTAAPVLIFEATDHAQRFGYGRAELLEWLDSIQSYTFFELEEYDVIAVPEARIVDFSSKYRPLTR